MKLSQLARKIERIREKHGDLDVWVRTGGHHENIILFEVVEAMPSAGHEEEKMEDGYRYALVNW